MIVCMIWERLLCVMELILKSLSLCFVVVVCSWFIWFGLVVFILFVSRMCG